ncbi:hypothetical protein BS47DRAFT_1402514 [Hydnum rufescens UP504]|uniref:Uncharacterized protein n=1 Tax=Hydnum rufescens UP504 TaxID=1448309 RepID=A0A9P6DLR6_9AGAM|nr:hypothetical protein BS47DRAFT_1402514 [Hydnum rufescens UP504]
MRFKSTPQLMGSMDSIWRTGISDIHATPVKVYVRFALNYGFAGLEHAAESSLMACLGTTTSRSPKNRHTLMSTGTFVLLWLPDVHPPYCPVNMWLTSAGHRSVISRIDSVPRNMVSVDFHIEENPKTGAINLVLHLLLHRFCAVSTLLNVALNGFNAIPVSIVEDCIPELG